jgi:hypothetical protein
MPGYRGSHYLRTPQPGLFLKRHVLFLNTIWFLQVLYFAIHRFVRYGKIQKTMVLVQVMTTQSLKSAQ